MTMLFYKKDVKRILVTGGSGFIGSNLVRKLLKHRNIRVYNLDRNNYFNDFEISKKYITHGQYNFVKINLADAKQTKQAIDLIQPDLVFHLAAESHVDNSILRPLDFLNSNIIGTFNLLEALVKYWHLLSTERKKKFRLIHVSTDEVFGSAEEGCYFSEKSQYCPSSPYASTKAASDHLVRSWHDTYGLPVIITNCCNNFGPWQFPEKLIPLIINKCLSTEAIPIYGNGKNVRDWIYVDDHIDALLQVFKKGEVGTSYCIGSNQLKTNEEVVEVICNLLDFYKKENSPHIRLKKYVSDRPGHDLRYAIDNTKIKKELNWFPKYDFNQGINITVRWYLDNINWLNQFKSF